MAYAARVPSTTHVARSPRNRIGVVNRPARILRAQSADTKSQSRAKGAANASPPKVDSENALMLYEDMFFGREFEDMCAQMYYRGKMFGFVHLYSGQEAVSTGFIKSLRKDDFICSTYRDHVHALSKGVPAREVMAELFGKTTGLCRGQGGSMHMFSEEYNMVRTALVKVYSQGGYSSANDNG